MIILTRVQNELREKWVAGRLKIESEMKIMIADEDEKQNMAGKIIPQQEICSSK